MSDASPNLEQLLQILGDLCNGSIDADQFAKLDQLLQTDDDALQLYVEYLDQEAELVMLSRPQPAETAVPVLGDPIADHEESSPIGLQASLLSSTASLLGGWVDGTRHFISAYTDDHPATFSYIVASVLFVVGIFAASHVYITTHAERLALQNQNAAVAKNQETPLAPSAEESPEKAAATSQKQNRMPQFVGRITSEVGCRWKRDVGRGARGEGTENHKSKIINQKSPSLVALGDKLTIASGLLEITFDTGAKVILEGPCRFNVETNGGFLAVGRLTGRMEKGGEGRGARGEGKTVNSGQWAVDGKVGVRVGSESASTLQIPKSQNPEIPSSNSQSLIPNPSLATSHQPLATPFAIATPTAIVTDLGTEFGVEVPERGDAIVCVFQGKVDCQPILHSRPLGERSQVVAGQTAFLMPKKTVVHKTSPSVKTFVRQMPTPTSISLADFVVGSNGFGNVCNWGVDLRDGGPTSTFSTDRVESNGEFELFNGYPQVNGVFIPLGGKKPVQIDSAGHTFVFPKTTGDSYGPVWVSRIKIKRKSPGGDFWTSCRAMQLHANAGITFNLKAIRALTPNLRVARLQTTVVNQPAMQFDPKCGADVWVLVDGQLRFHRAKLRNADGPVEVSIPLQSDDRYLTFVSTDGGDGSYFDSIEYCDPRLILEPNGKSEARTAQIKLENR